MIIYLFHCFKLFKIRRGAQRKYFASNSGVRSARLCARRRISGKLVLCSPSYAAHFVILGRFSLSLSFVRQKPPLAKLPSTVVEITHV